MLPPRALYCFYIHRVLFLQLVKLYYWSYHQSYQTLLTYFHFCISESVPCSVELSQPKLKWSILKSLLPFTSSCLVPDGAQSLGGRSGAGCMRPFWRDVLPGCSHCPSPGHWWVSPSLFCCEIIVTMLWYRLLSCWCVAPCLCAWQFI